VPVLLFLLALVVAGVVAYFSWQAKQKRREFLATFALQHGLTFSAMDPGDFEENYGFHLFSMGQGRGCENLLQGQWQGVPMHEADYWYYTTTTDGEGRTTRQYSHFSVVVIDLDAVLPNVSVGRENVMTRLADHLGMEDIEFESDEFNRCFNVKAKDKEFAFKLIDDRMMQWLLDAPDKICVEVVGPNVLLYCKRLPPEQVTKMFFAAKGFVDHVPKLVWSEYGKAAS
jgi:hypothetical protein